MGDETGDASTGPALLFDLDRTLVDIQSYTDYRQALRRVEAAIATWHEPPTPPSGWDAPTQRAMGVLLALSEDSRRSVISALLEDVEAAAIEQSVPMPGLGEALRLSATVPGAVVTLLTSPTASAALTRHGPCSTSCVPPTGSPRTWTPTGSDGP